MVIVGRPVLTLFNPSTMHISANIEEKNIGKIAVGNVVDISVDAYPDLKLKGWVEKIITATNSRFSLIPAEGTSGIYVKVNQRVPIRITVEIPTGLNLGPGLSVEVNIHISKHSDINNE
jgi:multidrug resistance efflux pump